MAIKKKVFKSTVKRFIAADLKDETDDRLTYIQQARKAGKHLSKGDKKILRGIARDEADHHKKLRRIEKRLRKK